MTDGILIFTFSPVQSFIAEARRTSDLYAGSRILVLLAKAAAQVLQQRGRLIYPSEVNGRLPDDIPNKIVARVPWDEAQALAKAAREALQHEWQRIAETARKELAGTKPAPDETWHYIWRSQTRHQWEVYWAAAAMQGRTYAEAYEEASRALEAAKRSRVFDAVVEEGMKDSLSGRRAALRTGGMDARAYWKAVGRSMNASRLRPEGRERLDSIGAIKRFGNIRGPGFPSTSTVAGRDFLRLARGRLDRYRDAVQALLGEALYTVRDDAEWPYDGDLLYIDTLAPNRLKDSYGVQKVDEPALERCRELLVELYKEIGAPSPYYAVIVLDGDSMGQQVAHCLKSEDPEEAHRALSGRLSAFAAEVPNIVTEHRGQVVYNGGDDVLALAPLAAAVPLSQKLADTFMEVTGGITASAGIAIAHHLYPLDAALRAARQAERGAKKMTGKDALCIQVLRRGGETTLMRSKWSWADGNAALASIVDEMATLFQQKTLSSRLAYDVARSSYALAEPGDMLESELRRLLKRHTSSSGSLDGTTWAARLREWGTTLPAPGPEELGRWLIFARFLGQGGGD